MPKYDAFISYRRVDGSRFAHRLRHRLLSYKLPSEFRDRFKKLNIYVDTIYENASEDFFENTIKPALRESKALIVVQTPGAVAPLDGGDDNWVAREVRYFRSLPQGNRIWVGLAIGGYSDPLPSALERELPNIERVDIRTFGRFFPTLSERELVKFVAPLFEIRPEEMPELRRETEIRMRRRYWTRVGVTTGVAIAASALAITAAIGWWTAGREAEKQRALKIAAKARSVPGKEFDLALDLAAAAHKAAPQADTSLVLTDLFNSVPQMLRYFHCPADTMANAVAFADQGQVVLLGCGDVASAWRLEDGAAVSLEADWKAWLEAKREAASRGGFEPERLTAVTCGGFEPVDRYYGPAILNGPDGLDAYLTEDNLVIASLQGRCLELRGNTHNVFDLDVWRGAESLLLASAGQIGRQRFGAIVWDLRQRHPLGRRVTMDATYANAVEVSADGSVIGVVQGGRVTLWRVDGTSVVRLAASTEAGLSGRLAVRPDGAEVTTVDYSGVATRFVRHGDELRAVHAGPHGDQHSAGYDDAGELLLLAKSGRLSTWDGKQLGAVTDDLEQASCVRLDAAHRRVLYELDGQVVVYSFATNPVSRRAAPLRDGHGVCEALATDGDRLLVRGEADYGADPIQLLDVASGSSLGALTVPYTSASGLSENVRDLELSRDGRWLVVRTSGDGDALTIWDLSDRGIAARFETGDLTDFALAPDGTRLVTLHPGEIGIWDLEQARWRDKALEIANRPLTTRERDAAGL